MSEVVYTIGASGNYDRYMREDPDLRKGVGGSVWRTKDEVEDYLKNVCDIVTLPGGQSVQASIYSVLLPNGWDQDTEIPQDAPGASWRALKVSAKIIAKVMRSDGHV